MGLASKLNALTETSAVKHDTCSVGLLLFELTEDDRKALQSALTSPASTRSIYDALRTEGFRIDRQSLTLHRKGFCRCKESGDE